MSRILSVRYVLAGISLLLIIVGLAFVLLREEVSYAELRYVEYSAALGEAAGSIVPASCESDPWLVANGDGNFSGCYVCWDGSIPAQTGQPCPAEVVGACDYSSPNSCSSGTLGANAVQGNGDYHWYCDGNPNTDTNRSGLCWYSPPPMVNGSCDWNNVYSCLSGTSADNNPQADGSFHWNCNGSNGGTNEFCWYTPPPVVNGSCSPAGPNGNEPVYGCLSGTSADNNPQADGSFHWNCNGSNGGTNEFCWYVPPVDGDCDLSSPNSCSRGVLGWNSTDGSGNYDWLCDGLNGGAQSVICHYYAGVPPPPPPPPPPSGGTPVILEFRVCTTATSECTFAPGTHTVATGTPLTVYWDSNSDSCSAVAGPGFSTGGLSTGSDPVTAVAVPGTPDAYTVACRYGSGIPVQSTLYVASLGAGGGGGPVLTVSETMVEVNQSITVSWDTNNGDETLCSLTGGGLNDATLDAGGGGTAETGSVNVVINGRTTFILTCNGLSAAKTVDIIPSSWEN